MSFEGYVKGISSNCWRTDLSNPGLNYQWVLQDGSEFILSCTGDGISLSHYVNGTETVIWKNALANVNSYASGYGSASVPFYQRFRGDGINVVLRVKKNDDNYSLEYLENDVVIKKWA